MTRHAALDALNALSLATIPESPRRRNRADRIAEAQVYALLAIADALDAIRDEYEPRDPEEKS